MSEQSMGNLVVTFRELNCELQRQLSAVTKERDELRGALERIAEAYRAMFPVDDCPPMPHGCDRCEIHYWLNDVVPLQPGDDA